MTHSHDDARNGNGTEWTAPPHDRAAERALLGSMLRDDTTIAKAIALIRATDLYVVAHCIIFRAIVDLHSAGKPVDIVTVAQALSSANAWEEIGGHIYLAELNDAAPCAGHWQRYCEVILEHSQRRQIIRLSDDLRERAQDLGEKPGDALNVAELRLSEIAGIRNAGGYRFAAIDSKVFATADFRPAWLIKKLLVKDQPCIMGGPKKALKTSLLIDLVLSLGSGLPFLGHFVVPKKVRSVLISGESGRHTIQETARRVAFAKGIDLATADVLWDFRLPQLANAIDLAAFGRGLQGVGAGVAIIDPLYLSLLAGQGEQGLQATNLYDMGPLLLRVAETCLDAGATPILAHHAKKGRTTGAYEPLELDDLAFSGIAEFARQWMLLSRREPFEPGSGIHRLWLSTGGSIGHCGLWALDVDEGHLDEDFSGRRWAVKVSTAGDSRRAEHEARDDQRAQNRKSKDTADDAAVLQALDRLDPGRDGAGYTKVRQAARLNGDRMTRAVDRLAHDRVIEELWVHIVVGNGAKREVKGLRRGVVEHANIGTEHRDNLS